MEAHDFQKSFFIAEAGNPALQRILHDELGRDQRPYRLLGRIGQPRQLDPYLFDMIQHQPLHPTRVDHQGHPLTFGEPSGKKGQDGLGEILERGTANQPETVTDRIKDLVRAG